MCKILYKNLKHVIRFLLILWTFLCLQARACIESKARVEMFCKFLEHERFKIVMDLRFFFSTGASVHAWRLWNVSRRFTNY